MDTVLMTDREQTTPGAHVFRSQPGDGGILRSITGGTFSKDSTMTGLPYFKFMVADYLGGGISRCSYETQGIFIRMVAEMWKNGGTLKRDEDYLCWLLSLDKQRLSDAIAQLEYADILIDIGDNHMTVEFVQEQIEELTARHDALVKAGRKGGKAKQLKRASKAKATLKPGSSIQNQNQLHNQKQIQIPAGLDTERFKRAWEEWIQHRTEIKKKLTPTSITRQLKAMNKWGEDRAVAAIHHTIEKGWQGLQEPTASPFEPKPYVSKLPKGNPKDYE
jgi:uncharacterized protein YdaU (DUF1376 family)